MFVKERIWGSHLRSNAHKNKSLIPKEKNVEIIKSAFQQRIVSYRVSSEGFFINIKTFFENVKPTVVNLLREAIIKHTCIKFNLELFGLYLNPSNGMQDVKSFNTPFEVAYPSSKVDEICDDMFQIMEVKASEFAERDSGNFSIINVNPKATFL